jgi:exopolyphosphatase/guanosine-5'-triphosphate,3'-diphosphate pyrophosphatase
MVVHADLPSYTRREVEIIANICRYHRRRGPGSGQATFRRLGDDDQRLVTHLVGILRIADGLDRTHQQDVADVGVTATVRRTIFDVAAKAQPAANMLAARRKADVFERAFRTRVRLVWTAAQDAASEPAIIEEEVAEIA